MKTYKEYITEKVSKQQVSDVEKFADKLFAKVGVDVDLSSKHFYERINDKRNDHEVTSAELVRLFRNLFKKHGKLIGGMTPGIQGVITEINSNNNLPFMIKYDKKNKELDITIKTFMAKPDFRPAKTDKHLKI